jgi:DNA-binding IscR family transcriptional regulator
MYQESKAVSPLRGRPFLHHIVAITVVADIALHSAYGRVALSHELAKRLRLTRRQIEKTLQALVRGKVLIGKTGPRGDYTLARHPEQITAADIVQILEQNESARGKGKPSSLQSVVTAAFLEALQRVTILDIVRSATAR